MSRGSLIYIATALSIVGTAAAPGNCQPPLVETVPTTQPQPSVDIRATVTSTRRFHKKLLDSLSSASEKIRDLKLQAWITELQPQITARMPQQGGVLLVAYFDETRVGEGIFHSFRSANLRPYASEAQAKADFERDHVTIAPIDPPPAPPAERPRLTTKPKLLWFPAPLAVPRLIDYEDVAKARTRLNQLLAVAKEIYEPELARLQIEWHAIEAENKRINEARVRLGRHSESQAVIIRQGATELAAWESGERQSISALQSASIQSRQSAQAERSAGAAMANERCPAGKSIDECEVHTDWQAQFHARRNGHIARAAQYDAQASQQDVAAQARQSRLESGKAARQAAINARAEAAAGRAAEAEALNLQEAAFTQRLLDFESQDSAMQALAETTKEIQKLLSEIR